MLLLPRALPSPAQVFHRRDHGHELLAASCFWRGDRRPGRHDRAVRRARFRAAVLAAQDLHALR